MDDKISNKVDENLTSDGKSQARLNEGNNSAEFIDPTLIQSLTTAFALFQNCVKSMEPVITLLSRHNNSTSLNENINQSKDSITDEKNKEPEKLPESVERESLIQNKEDEEPTPTQQPKTDEIDMNKSGDQMDKRGDQEMTGNEKVDEEISESTQKEIEEIPQNKSQDHVVPIEMETTNSNSMLESMEINDTIKDMIKTTKAGDLTNGEIQNVSTTVRNIDIEIESSSHPSEVAESLHKSPQKSPIKSPQKSPRKSNTWSTAVTGSSQRIDAFAAPPAEEPIKVPTPKKTKVISSDGNDNNSLIDDEAMKVGSDEESMTKSDRDYMEQNEIVEDGESLMSKDSNANEIKSDSGHESYDSFNVDDEVKEQYNMNTSEEEIEEIERPKRKSRIIQQSSSEDEAEIESQNDEPEKEDSISPSKPATPQKSPAKEKSVTPQQSPVKEKSATPQQSPEKSASSPEKSPQKSAKKRKVDTLIDSAKRISTRHSLPIQTATGSSKKSRNSIPPSWTVEDNDESGDNVQESEEIQNVNERKRKRESVVHGAAAKRFKEMSPNESEARNDSDDDRLIIDEQLGGFQLSEDYVAPIEMETINSNSMLEPMEIDDTIKDMMETTQVGDLTDTSLRVEVRMTEKHKVIEYQEGDMMSEIESSSHPSEVAESLRKSPQKLQDKSPLKSAQKSSRKSNTWSTAVTGSSQRIDAFTAPPTEESIKAPTLKKSKVTLAGIGDNSEDDASPHLAVPSTKYKTIELRRKFYRGFKPLYEDDYTIRRLFGSTSLLEIEQIVNAVARKIGKEIRTKVLAADTRSFVQTTMKMLVPREVIETLAIVKNYKNHIKMSKEFASVFFNRLHSKLFDSEVIINYETVCNYLRKLKISSKSSAANR